MPVEVIDVKKYDDVEEKEKIKKKTQDKEKNLESTREAKKRHMDNTITNPFYGAKKDSEAKKKQEIAQLEKLYEEIEAKKIKTEATKVDAEVKKVVAEVEENKAYIELEQQIEEYSGTEIAQQTCDGINNLISGGVYRDQIKKELLRRNLKNNLLIQRSNHRLSFNIINRMPLMVQYPLFVGMEILKTEDQYKTLVLTHQIQQQQAQSQTQRKTEPQPEPPKEEKQETKE